MTCFPNGDKYRQRLNGFWYTPEQEAAICNALTSLEPSRVALAQTEMVLHFGSNLREMDRSEIGAARDRSRRMLAATQELAAFVYEKDHMWALDGADRLPSALEMIENFLTAEIDGYDQRLARSSATNQPNKVRESVVAAAFHAWENAGGEINYKKDFRAFFVAVVKPAFQFHQIPWTDGIFKNEVDSLKKPKLAVSAI